MQAPKELLVHPRSPIQPTSASFSQFPKETIKANRVHRMALGETIDRAHIETGSILKKGGLKTLFLDRSKRSQVQGFVAKLFLTVWINSERGSR